MLAQETIFLTGFPGFIAARLIKELARGGARFLLLVQPALVARARDESARLAEESGTNADRFRIVEGDITCERLGMSAADYELACAETTVLFHLAAIYDLGVRREAAMQVNVEGTRRVNELARACKRRLRHYHYVSTCYVAGLRTGLIREDELEHAAGFRNFYEETKYLAEVEVERLKGELPVTIHRPAVVCGDSQTGETAKYDGVYYLIKYILMQPKLLSLANIGNAEVRLNIVPVDFVVAAMTALARDERAVGATLQLADPQPLTTAELFEMIAQSLAGRGALVTLPKPLVRASLLFPRASLLTKLPRVGVPYFFINQTYDTSRAAALLDAHGVSCPRFSFYVDALTAYVKAHPRLS